MGAKNALLFRGEAWADVPALAQARNVLTDMLRGRLVTELDLAGLQHCIVCEATAPGTIELRVVRVVLKKSGTRLPRVEIEEAGPWIKLELTGRSHEQKWPKAATAKAPELGTGKKKNIEIDEHFGDTLGRIHMERQDFSGLALRKNKAFKDSRRRAPAGGDDDDADESWRQDFD